MPSSTATEYLLRDEYIDRRNDQEKLISDAFNSVRNSVALVRDEVKSFKNDVEAQFAVIGNRLEELGSRVGELDSRVGKRLNELDLSIRRMEAYSRNNNLRNPTFRINPIVSYRPDRGIIQPDSRLYPQNAKEFYSLRQPQDQRQKDMLAYLIEFYDLPYTTWRVHPPSDYGSSSDDEINPATQNLPSHEMTIEDAVCHQSELAIDLLEGILGLNSDNFVKFEQKAAEHRHRTVQPAKRYHDTTYSDGNRGPGARKQIDSPSKRSRPLDIRLQRDGQEYVDTKADHDDDKSTSAGVGWDNTTSPSINGKLRAIYHHRGSSSNTGTTTNPNTTSLSKEPAD